MATYTKNTGSSGMMRIVDNGSVVTFSLNSNNGSTFSHDLPWGYTVNGVTNNTRTVDYSAGAGWVTCGSWTVSTSQTVTFRIFDTGTSGFGGPTTFSVAISRATVPGAPSKVTFSSVGSTTLNANFTDGSNGGSAIDSRQLARNTVNTTTGATIISSDGSTTVSGLSPGTTYYFWARTHNSVGWGPWSPVANITMLRVPDTPSSVIVSDVKQSDGYFSFVDGASNGGSAIVERQLAFNTINTTTGSTPVAYTGVTHVINLAPATTWYVWARVRNSVGWSPYSPVKSFRTRAGALVNVAGVWKEAVPYVKDAGVWKLAEPHSKIAGVWKETS